MLGQGLHAGHGVVDDDKRDEADLDEDDRSPVIFDGLDSGGGEGAKVQRLVVPFN